MRGMLGNTDCHPDHGRVAGIRDSEGRRHLLSVNPFPSLQAVVDFCRSTSAARADDRSLGGKPISRIQQQREGSRPRPDDERTKSAKPTRGACGRHHASGDPCPATSKLCSTCNKPGHFSSRCPNRPQRTGNGAKEKGAVGVISVRTIVGAASPCPHEPRRRHRLQRISVDLLNPGGWSMATIINTVPD